MTIRPAVPNEFNAVASLIHQSTNSWYEKNRGHHIFDPCDPLACRLFTDVYEDLDPECCLVAVSDDGQILGSCFYHPRETHVSLGIMNTHPEAAGKGVARALVEEIIRRSDGIPVRLVSSAMNLDSFSLYTKAGFSPQTLFQDMQFPNHPDFDMTTLPNYRIREATLKDAPIMADLEMSLCGIRREKDIQYFIENKREIWRCLVVEVDGVISGFLNSVNHPASHMLGPGVATDQNGALALILGHHQAEQDSQPVFLVPAAETKLVTQLYQLGAKNLELHVSQVLGELSESMGVTMPTFMPETG